jgi:hypothetical protein
VDALCVPLASHGPHPGGAWAAVWRQRGSSPWSGTTCVNCSLRVRFCGRGTLKDREIPSEVVKQKVLQLVVDRIAVDEQQ